jgi:DNA-binding NarL/FixJ family response regulator
VTRARILLADAHEAMRDRVVDLLKQEFEMLEPVADGLELLESAAELKPDLCLLDISMPLISGIEAATQLKESGSPAKIVFLTIHEDIDFVQAAFRAGASGYVIKSNIATELLVALKEVLAGGCFISASLIKVPAVDSK